ncbi:MAG TPA: prolyl oligopeptidase family serine peptidase [Gemmataceae bacterium]|nr:prolyl oligopeptidase family serine peptidase [Gemmataceae bacterium]
MKAIISGTLLALVAFTGCNPRGGQPPRTSSPSQPTSPRSKAVSLTEARKGFQTKLVGRASAKEPLPVPPPTVFRTIHFDAPVGKLAAYLSPDPKDGKKHPAIVWITGGDCNSIGDVWSDAPARNDQTASAFRKAGIVMMFPSLRGGNDNPGVKEGFLGEVDDVLAAADFLGKQNYVDPRRIYLGGHSTGGTLVLLVAECSDRFRAIFSFGPAHDVRGYDPEYIPFDTSNRREAELRSPGRWLASIQSPTFVFEGTLQGNIDSLQVMARSSTNAKAHFLAVQGATHFSILAPTNRLIADRILRDDGPACNLAFASEELSKPFAK